MIDILFEKLGEVILVKVEGTKILFGSTSFGAALTDISGLKLSKEGVIKEHPDLKDNPDWETEAVIRFTEKIKSYSTEEERASYIIHELKGQNYKPLQWQKKGFRPNKIE